jgi:hypothetical protein
MQRLCIASTSSGDPRNHDIHTPPVVSSKGKADACVPRDPYPPRQRKISAAPEPVPANPGSPSPSLQTNVVFHAERLEPGKTDPHIGHVQNRLDGMHRRHRAERTRLITAFENGDGTRRGIHEGDFLWKGKGAVAVGTISGIINAGTHREPIFKPCQTCDAKGWMEGRFCGTIRQSQRPGLRGCQVIGTYRFHFDPNKTDGGRGVITGTLEGEIVCACPG